MANSVIADVEYDGKMYRYAMFVDDAWCYLDRRSGKLMAFRHQELVHPVRWMNACLEVRPG